MLRRLGGWNYAAIVIISGIMGFFSIFLRISPEELALIRGSWWTAFLERQLRLVIFSFVALCLLGLFNVINDLMSGGDINKRRLIDIVFFGMIVCVTVTLLGNLWMMTRN